MPKKSTDSGSENRISITTLKGTRAWAEWLSRLADHDRNSLVGLIDRALAEYAKTHGFAEPPPRR